MMRTLFLQAPSFEGFDGGAGSRYQARREIRSFWYPTWLAQPAALIPGSKLIDAPSHGISMDAIVAQADQFDLAVLHTSAPSFASDLAPRTRFHPVPTTGQLALFTMLAVGLAAAGGVWLIGRRAPHTRTPNPRLPSPVPFSMPHAPKFKVHSRVDARSGAADPRG